MKRILAILFICAAAGRLPAMDRYEALSQIESGDNDRAIGRDGEITRYQISPRVRQEWHLTGEDLKTPALARAAAERIMRQRVACYVKLYGEQPGDFAWYLLWNCPRGFLTGKACRWNAMECDRAQRFANLCSRKP